MVVLISFYLLLMFASIILGYKEGMIMLQSDDPNDAFKENGKGGLKEHIHYDDIYHYVNTTACLLVAIAFGLAGYYHSWEIVGYAGIIPFLLSVYCMLNEVAELAYSWSRFRILIPQYENFIFLELYKKLLVGDEVRIAHLVRSYGALIFLIYSLF